MSHEISQLNKAFDSRIRLGIMSALSVNEKIEFSVLKEMLELTDGNLASHISALEKLKYLEVSKQFIGKKPNTSYGITEEGRRAFIQHINALENLIRKSK
jgi:DNA-binding MarR family transcriptional regulator